MTFTKKESAVLIVLKESDFGVGKSATVREILNNGNCTCASVSDMSKDSGLNHHQVAGVLSALMEKGLVGEWDINPSSKEMDYALSDAGLLAFQEHIENKLWLCDRSKKVRRVNIAQNGAPDVFREGV